jgi:hypothetical protein
MTTSSSIDRARTLARSAAARLRAWFEPPLEDDARPLEIRNAVLDRVEQLAEPAAAGRRVLPRNRMVVTLLAQDENARDLLRVALTDLEDAIGARLAELRCPVPHGFCVEVAYVDAPRADWRQGQRFSVELTHSAGGRTPAATPGASRAGAESAEPVPAMHIAVTKGAATAPEYVFSETKVLIGRTSAPVDRAGRPRYNHIVFLDEGDEHNATVGRAHASIKFLPDRHQFRLFDDGSHNGTRIVRRGETIDVTPHNPAGVALLSGDEIQFGTAAVLVTIEDGL